MKRSLGGGSLTLLISLPGAPATGERTLVRVNGAAAGEAGSGANEEVPGMDAYKHLSDELKAKLAKALKIKATTTRQGMSLFSMTMQACTA